MRSSVCLISPLLRGILCMPSYEPSTLHIRHLLYKTGAMQDAGAELLLMGILRSSHTRSSKKFGRFLGALEHILRWSTYTPLTKEYAALVTGGAEPRVIRSNPPRVAHRVEETMMRHSETMRAASRLLLSHPIICLLAALAAAVVVLGVLGPLKVVHAADVAVEDEKFAKPPTGTIVVS